MTVRWSKYGGSWCHRRHLALVPAPEVSSEGLHAPHASPHGDACRVRTSRRVTLPHSSHCSHSLLYRKLRRVSCADSVHGLRSESRVPSRHPTSRSTRQSVRLAVPPRRLDFIVVLGRTTYSSSSVSSSEYPLLPSPPLPLPSLSPPPHSLPPSPLFAPLLSSESVAGRQGEGWATARQRRTSA
jgi:hypothetical protein